MDFKKLKFRIGLFLSVVFFIPFAVLAQSSNNLCSSTGYTILTINGVFTNDDGARKNMVALKDKVGLDNKGEKIDYDYLLNPTHLGGLGDLAMAVYQKAFENETVADYDLIEMLNDASAKVKTQKLLLVAHSQGNFYANSFYDTIVDTTGGIPAKSIGIYSVANPASRVAGKGSWITSDTDRVIAGLVAHLAPFHTIMPTNVHIAEVAGDTSLSAGHNFSEVYLKYKGTQIVKGIQESLDKLSSDPTRSKNTPCIEPPKITLTHKAEGLTLAVLDTSINTTGSAFAMSYDTYRQLAVMTYQGGVVVTKGITQLVSAVATLLKGDTGNLAVKNSASVILADQAQPPEAQVSPTGSQPLEKKIVAVVPLPLQDPVIDVAPEPVPNPTEPAVIESQIPTEPVPEKEPVETKPSIFGPGGFSGFGGGAPLAPIVKEVEAAVVVDTPVALEPVMPLVPAYESSAVPLAPADTKLSSAEINFSGTYSNATTFDKIIFELKNTSLDTATSSITRPLTATKGENLLYEEKITLDSEGSWQYRVRLEDSTATTSTAWSSVMSFTLATSTPVILKKVTLPYQQTDDTAHTQSHEGMYSIQTHIHPASESVWDIKKIAIRFNPADDNNLSINDCKLADISFPVHSGAWNGTQNNIAAMWMIKAWAGVTVRADDTTKTCTYFANFGNLAVLDGGVDYDMVFSGQPVAGTLFQIYGSPQDTAVGTFGHFLYGENASSTPDEQVADAFFEIATSTDFVVAQDITPLAPLGTTATTTQVTFSGTYSDPEGSFNSLRFETEATSTTGNSSSGALFSIPRVLGVDIPFSEVIDFTSDVPLGVRYRVQAWDPNFWGPQGSNTAWNGSTGYSDWKYFNFEPTPPAPVVATSTPSVVINEIAWMGTEASANDEWIELLNTTNTPVDLTGWTLRAADGVPELTLAGTVSANGYYLIERGHDTVVRDISADLIAPFSGTGTGSGLANTGEKLELYQGLIKIDETSDVASGWVAGANGVASSTRRTMERISGTVSGSVPSNWSTNTGLIINGEDSTGNLIQGTPRAKNSVTP